MLTFCMPAEGEGRFGGNERGLLGKTKKAAAFLFCIISDLGEGGIKSCFIVVCCAASGASGFSCGIALRLGKKPAPGSCF